MNGMCFRRALRAFGLIEVLVVVALLLLLAAFLLPRYLGGKTPEGKTVRAPMTAAKDTVCRTNLGTVRQGLETLKAGDPDGQPAPSLAELRLGSEVTRCAVGGEEYLYDPQTGQVRCPHPGHESF